MILANYNLNIILTKYLSAYKSEFTNSKNYLQFEVDSLNLNFNWRVFLNTRLRSIVICNYFLDFFPPLLGRDLFNFFSISSSWSSSRPVNNKLYNCMWTVLNKNIMLMRYHINHLNKSFKQDLLLQLKSSISGLMSSLILKSVLNSSKSTCFCPE